MLYKGMIWPDEEDRKIIEASEWFMDLVDDARVEGYRKGYEDGLSDGQRQ